jgi:hypothetical protein
VPHLWALEGERAMEFWSPVMGSVIMLLLLLPVHATAPAVQLVAYLFAIFKMVMNMKIITVKLMIIIMMITIIMMLILMIRKITMLVIIVNG